MPNIRYTHELTAERCDRANKRPSTRRNRFQRRCWPTFQPLRRLQQTSFSEFDAITLKYMYTYMIFTTDVCWTHPSKSA